MGIEHLYYMTQQNMFKGWIYAKKIYSIITISLTIMMESPYLMKIKCSTKRKEINTYEG